MLFAILAIISFGLQNLCCKEYGRRFPDTLHAQSVMIAISMIAVTAIMAALGGMRALTGKGYVLSVLFGIFFVVTLASMTLAMNYGHMGITLLIQNSSLVVPTLYGIVAWNERLTPVKGVGILCILLLLALSSGDATGSGDAQQRAGWNRRLWLLFTALAFIGDSMLGVLQGMMSRECATTDSVTFTFWTSLVSLIVAALLLLYCALRGQSGGLIRSRGAAFPLLLLCIGIGVGTAGGNCFTISALTRLPGMILFPLRQGALVLLMWMLGIVIYRERMNRRGLLMLLSGLLGMVLLNL